MLIGGGSLYAEAGRIQESDLPDQARLFLKVSFGKAHDRQIRPRLWGGLRQGEGAEAPVTLELPDVEVASTWYRI